MSLLQTVRQFFKSVESVDTSTFEGVGKLNDFVNKQPKKPKLNNELFF